MKKILVIRFSSLGDIVLTSPVVRNLKDAYPRATIFYLTKDRYKELASLLGGVDKVIDFEETDRHRGITGFFKLIAEIKKEKFDLAVDLHSNWRSRLIGKLGKFDKVVRYNKNSLQRYLMVYFKLFRLQPIITVKSYLRVLEKLKLNRSETKLELKLPSADRQSALDLANRLRASDRKPLIGICPGAKWENKKWLKENFLEVSKALIKSYQASIIFLGDERDRETINLLQSSLPEDKVITAIGFPFGKLATLISLCKLVISNDSGLLHLACALNIPTISIFGPTHPDLGFAPDSENNIVLTVNLSCSPCSLHGEKKCFQERRFCMEWITPEIVLESVKRILLKNGNRISVSSSTKIRIDKNSQK